MSDIRTIFSAGPVNVSFQWAISRGALESDDGLETAVILSLFTDKTAPADAILPDGSGDRRGYWADEDKGSLLWLLEREKATIKTAARAQRYALEALQWFKRDGIADEIEVTAEYVTHEMLKLGVTIVRQVAGKPVNHRFDYVWNPAQPAPFVPQVPPVLADFDGTLLVTEDGKAIGIF